MNSPSNPQAKRHLGQILIDQGILTEDQLRIALLEQLKTNQPVGRLLVQLGFVSEATHLYFTLGNQYAAQARWAEAQEAYFRAFTAEPDNPDYNYNLAVSLDQLRQRKPALEYYRKAIALGASRPAAFDLARARARAGELER